MAEMSDELVLALKALRVSMGHGTFNAEYRNDTGPNDDYFEEWWEVRNAKFETEEAATAFANLMNTIPCDLVSST